MFWQKKNDKGLPDLPPIQPKIFDAPKGDFEDEEEIIEKHALPAFPDSPQKKGFAQSAIKSAIEEPDEKEPSFPEKEFKTLEVDESPKEEKLLPPPVKEIPSPAPQPFSSPVSLPEPEKSIPKAPKSPKSGEIFVKIDKFYSAKKALDSTKAKISEIDELLKRIREGKMREEQELSSWEKEMENIRSRIKEISEGIFEKTE